jgi:maltooligosyltrehalose trehalohydrolase
MTHRARARGLLISELKRRLPVGAEYIDGRAHLRLWAPAAQRVDVVVNGHRDVRLDETADHYFEGWIDAAPGDRYQFRLNSTDGLFPDPASRYQPEGPHRASAIVDPSAYRWNDRDWRGVALQGQVLYELHTGTFTGEGTWAAAARQLPALADLGVTVVELMPVAEFDGRFGWGYDGVDLFAPSHLYGTPDDLRHFVDRAHAVGLGVILDVVYNHLGPSGNYLRSFAPGYFTDRHDNEWGDALNFDGEDAAPVREFFIANAGYWIDEFHFDGLRLDATQQIVDHSREHVVAAIGAEVREKARGRSTIIVAENEPQDVRLVAAPHEGGYGLDGLWNDDFHHSAAVALIGRAEAYYCDTRGEPQEFVSAAKYGYLFQGQHYEWQRKPRGSAALAVDPARFVVYLQNHDQIANSATGRRLHELTSPGKWRAMTALTLLMPGTPMLFQGQEFASSAPFLYFADFDADLMQAVGAGRAEFLLQFGSVHEYHERKGLADPASPSTFERCKLDFAERDAHAGTYALHRDLLRLRRETPAFAQQRRGAVDGAVLSPSAFVLRFFGRESNDDRLLLVNLGGDLNRPSFAEPLMAPPADRHWRVTWSSEDPRYGGTGTPPVVPEQRWHVPGEAAVVLEPCDRTPLKYEEKRRRTA